MSFKQSKQNPLPGRPVVTIAAVKVIRALPRSVQKKTMSYIRRGLREQGIYAIQWEGLWLAVADRPLTSKEIGKRIVSLSLQSRRIHAVKLHGGYSFTDFLSLQTAPANGGYQQTPDDVARSFMQMMGMQMANMVLRQGNPSWPAWDDLQAALPTLPFLWRRRSRLDVKVGDQHA